MGMVEKVARAICAAVPGTGDIDEHFSDEFPLARRHWTEMARAAIEALREPTKEMLDAAYVGSKIGDFMDALPDEVLSQAFTDMIDAALKETNP